MNWSRERASDEPSVESTDAVVADRRETCGNESGMMISKIIASAVVMLAVGAGVAYAATQLASSDGTQVCVNQTNGLMRASSTCREGEYPLTIGGGGSSVKVTNGTFADVPWDTTSAGVKLPLTGVTVAGTCVVDPPSIGGLTRARLLVTTDAGMTAFTYGGGTIGGNSLLTGQAAIAGGALGGQVGYGLGPDTLVNAHGATATITFGAQVSVPASTCTYYGQAVEAPN